MTAPNLLKPFLLVALLCFIAPAQTSVSNERAPTKEDAKPDFSKEGVVIELSKIRVDFKNDGTSKRQQKTRVRVQSQAGVQQYGVLTFPYQASVERVDIDYVRVQKPDGTVIATPPDFVQDMPSEVSRVAPFYSDLREKHVAVKRLDPGDTLEFAATWQQDKPLAPGNFWLSWEFTKTYVVLDDELEISIPRERNVATKSMTVQPTTHDEGDLRIFTWKTSHLESQSKTAEKHDLSYETARGLLPSPDVMISSFRSWDEVGRWYSGLQSDRVQPSPEVKAKAEELTKGLNDDDAKLKALYDYVSLRYRYVGIAFGIGRYQPHSAADILDNEYGDCKDKHTLLAALLNAVGIQAYPALINSSRVVDKDVPSPGQFDHVITVVPKGSELSWMDTTAEVAQVGLLVPLLREKPALVMTPLKSEFRTTPSRGPTSNVEKFRSAGKLSAEGVLDSDAEAEFRGDGELAMRLAFRRVPQAQWKDLVQTISYGGGFGGTVTDIQASAPEKTESPFKFTYHYNRKDYGDWENHRILACLPGLGLAIVRDEDLSREKPLWISIPGDWQYESRIELPKGFRAQLPEPLKLKEDYAEYESNSVMEGGVMVTKRHLLVKNQEVTPAQLKSYKAFQKAIADDHSSYIQLNTGTELASSAAPGPVPPGADVWRKAYTELPSSPNPEATEAETSARESLQSGDYSGAVADLRRAVSADPAFGRGWVQLGGLYLGMRQKNSALEALQKAVDAEPKHAILYKILAQAYAYYGERAQAIATWRKLQNIVPDDGDVGPALGSLYLAEKQYKDAIVFLEAAAKTNPDNAYRRVQLGSALLQLGEKERGLEALHKAVELNASPEILNDVAYEMADGYINLPEALDYSLRSIKEVEEKSQRVDLENVQPEDLRRSTQLAAYWDTLGWIYFRMGDNSRAESYFKAAFQLEPMGVVGDHLGQVYERERKLADAVHAYNLALEVSPRMEDTAARMRKLARVKLPATRMSAAEELSRMRTTQLPRIVKGTASADFYVLLAPGGKLKRSSFLRGSELLRFADDDLAKATFNVPFPAGSSAYVVRRGLLSCSSYTGCAFVFYPLGATGSPN